MEIHKNSFFEGAWDGPFDALRFDRAATVAGSGARLEDGGVLFCGPSHMCDRFQSVRVDRDLFVSNSLAFLLALSGERLDPNYPRYFFDFLDFRRVGIQVKEKRLRLLGRGFIELHDCCNLRVGPDLTATRIEKPAGPPPRDFAGYRSNLERTLQAMVENAGDAARICAYRPVTLLSQGYDSTAVSALASRAGCREALTFRRSGSQDGYEDDGGNAIAACLGLNIAEFERMDFEKLPDFRPDEFYIEPRGADRHMAVMEDRLPGSLLFTGRCTENIWPRRGGGRWGLPSSTGRPALQDVDEFHMAGRALGEFRLRIGFIDFPAGSTGAIHGPAIHSIGRSKEMEPYSLGGYYDKPLPRRIAEEAGVPRHLFGQKKKGGPARPVSERQSWISRVSNRMATWRPWREARLRLLGGQFYPNWSDGSYLVQSSMDRAVERYRTILSETKPVGVKSAETASAPYADPVTLNTGD